MKNPKLQGFTLVEMSIVLLIIAAIIGSTILGRSLITNSRLQTVITDLDSYTNAVTNFQQAYQGLPGDFTNAQTVWGTDSVGCPAGGGTSGTCKGDGNGQITNANSAGQVGESYLFWQHLYKAGMFSQNLSNQSAAAGADAAVIGTNVPAGSIRGSGFSVHWLGKISNGDANYFSTGSATPYLYGNVFYFGAASTSNVTYNPILPADQAAAIDSKIDDGLPGTGKVRTFINGSTIAPSCATAGSYTAATYNVSVSGNNCSLILVMGF